MRKLPTQQLSYTICVMAFVAACATTPAGSAINGAEIVREALSTPLSDLMQRAQKGDGRAQYALGLAHEYGLQGAEVNVRLSDEYKRAAMASRGTMPVTQYIPGLNGQPGRTAIITVANPGIRETLANTAADCAEALATNALPDRGGRACGSMAAYQALRTLWHGNNKSR